MKMVKQNQKGFTIVEVVLAIFILTMAVGGSVALVQQSLMLVSLNESKTTAAYLAQEGLEIARNVRDSNWLLQRTNPTVSWNAGLDAGSYEADYDDAVFLLDQDKFLSVNSDGFYYYPDPGQPSVASEFKRTISITDIDENSMQIDVDVRWQERGRSHSVIASEKLFNWYGY